MRRGRRDPVHLRVGEPLGLWGMMYGYAVWPLHQLVFAGMLRGVAMAAGKSDAK